MLEIAVKKALVIPNNKENEENKNEKEYKSCIETKIEKLGYIKDCYRTYKKVLKELPNIKQVIKLDLFSDRIDERECHVEAYFKIQKRHITYLNIALNRLDDDLKILKGDDKK